jgi:hypothetical protein
MLSDIFIYGTGLALNIPLFCNQCQTLSSTAHGAALDLDA